MDGSAISKPAVPAASARSPQALSRRETRWVRKRCAKHGHVLAHIDDSELAARFTASSRVGALLRCLRCGDFTSAPELAADATSRSATTVIGSAGSPADLGALPLVLRGGHGRKLALLRLLAIERGGRGLLMLLAAVGIARLATSHVAVAEWLGQLVKTAQPLGRLLGWDLQRSPTVTRMLHLLGYSDSTFRTIAWLLGAYGVLQIVEGVGLWGGWLWAEYLAAVATAMFIPIEVFELTEHATPVKGIAILVNVAAVGYLVFKGRLFGVRGGHSAYLAEVRDSTLLAAELKAIGRPGSALTSHVLV
ncbi:MAG TPA: DUF2127 domain-containing protein [Kineosporiaceae bacterium]|nr:DUF2127 domain-containing protein [Kineosporiaceae bacterium]